MLLVGHGGRFLSLALGIGDPMGVESQEQICSYSIRTGLLPTEKG